MSQRDRRDITIKEIEIEADGNHGHVTHIDTAMFTGQIHEVGADHVNPDEYHVSDPHVHNWVISGQLSNVNGHVDAPATPDNHMEIGGV